MKLIIVIITFCVILNLSKSATVENVLNEIGNTLQPKKNNVNSNENAALKCVAVLLKCNNVQDIINRVMKINDEIKNSRNMISAVHNEIKSWSLIIPENELTKIHEIERNFNFFANNLTQSFTNQVELSENNEIDTEALNKIFDSYEASNWTSEAVHTTLNEFTAIKQKISLMKLLQSSNALIIDRRTNKQQLLSDHYKHKLRIISIDLNSDISSPHVRETVRLLENEKTKSDVKYYIQDTPVPVPEIKVYLQGKEVKSFKVVRKEYVLLKDSQEVVRIIDPETHELIITYKSDEIGYGIAVIVDDRIYMIYTESGQIRSTHVENVMKPHESTKWERVGTFPYERNGIRNSATANDTSIYFVTYDGILYNYDTILKTVTKILNINVSSTEHASLVMMNNVLYIHMHDKFYSYDGNTLQEIVTPTSKFNPGIFKMEDSVCRVGGDNIDNRKMDTVNPENVDCYHLEKKTWSVIGCINKPRAAPAVVSTQFGIYVYGGRYYDKDMHTNYWRRDAEAFKTRSNTSSKQLWSHIMSPLTKDCFYVQAISFHF